MPHDSYISEAVRSVEESIDRAAESAATVDTQRAYQECRSGLRSCKTLDDVSFVRGIVHELKRVTLFTDVHATTSRASARLSKLTGR